MIFEKVIGNLSESAVKADVDYVELEWFEADKKRLRKTTVGGREVGIAAEKPLSDGDILYLDDKTCIAVKLTSCPLIRIPVDSMERMGRLCFEIGNRHMSLKIASDCVLIPYDEPMERLLQKLGYTCEKTVGRFDDFIVCKAHDTGHAHSHAHAHDTGHAHSHAHSHSHEHNEG